MSQATKEFDAIQTIHGALEPLDDEARTRVLTYIESLLGIGAARGTPRATPTRNTSDGVGRSGPERAMRSDLPYSSFAELYAAANPKSNGEKALLAGYWIQAINGAEGFSGAAANKELTDLGYKIVNITDAIAKMKNRTPSLILQTKKSGSSRQSRKTYRVSHEGIKRVEEMIGG